MVTKAPAVTAAEASPRDSGGIFWKTQRYQWAKGVTLETARRIAPSAAPAATTKTATRRAASAVLAKTTATVWNLSAEAKKKAASP